MIFYLPDLAKCRLSVIITLHEMMFQLNEDTKIYLRIFMKQFISNHGNTLILEKVFLGRSICIHSPIPVYNLFSSIRSVMRDVLILSSRERLTTFLSQYTQTAFMF